MDTERIDLPDGAWVEIRTVVTRRMRKAFRKAGIASVMSGGASNGSASVDLTDPEAVKTHLMAHPERWDLDAVDDAFLLHGVISWNWPGVSAGPLTIETFDALPAAVVETVLVRLRKLYAEATPETLKL